VTIAFSGAPNIFAIAVLIEALKAGLDTIVNVSLKLEYDCRSIHNRYVRQICISWIISASFRLLKRAKRQPLYIQRSCVAEPVAEECLSGASMMMGDLAMIQAMIQVLTIVEDWRAVLSVVIDSAMIQVLTIVEDWRAALLMMIDSAMIQVLMIVEDWRAALSVTKMIQKIEWAQLSATSFPQGNRNLMT
jgi:hypothetical protein